MIVPPATPPPDSIRAVVRRVMAAPLYDWRTPRDPLRELRELIARVFAWFARLLAHHPVIYWSLVVALAALLLGVLIPAVVRAVRASGRPREHATGGDRRRVPTVRDAAWHLAEMRRLRDEGRYADALAHRFAALLLMLQGAGAVEVRSWKTPAEYVRDAALDADRRGELRHLVGALYGYLFAGRPCDASALDDFDRRADALAASLAAR